MKSTQFIPEQYVIRSRNINNKEYPLGTPVPVSTTEQVQREISRTMGKINPKLMVYTNEPLDGYHCMLDWDNILLFHPDGYGIALTQYNIGIIIRECSLQNGSILDKLIFAFDNTYREWVVIPYGKDTYNEIKKQSDEFFEVKSGSVELTYGALINYSGTDFIFCGEYYSVQFSTKVRSIKRYLLKSVDGERYYISTVKVPDRISPNNTKITAYPESEIYDKVIKNNLYGVIKSISKTGSYNSRDTTTESITLVKTKDDLSKLKYSIGDVYDDDFTTLPLFEGTDGKNYIALDRYSHTPKSYFYISGYKNDTQYCVELDIQNLDSFELKMDSAGKLIENSKFVVPVKLVKIVAEL